MRRRDEDKGEQGEGKVSQCLSEAVHRCEIIRGRFEVISKFKIQWSECLSGAALPVLVQSMFPLRSQARSTSRTRSG